MSLDFAGLAARLLDRARTLLPQWFPAGKFEGHEFKLGNVNGEPGGSLSINIRTGVWKDFATGDGGKDLISLYAAANRIEQGEAFKELNDGIDAVPVTAPPKTKDKAEDWEIIQPVPADAPEPPRERFIRQPNGQWQGLPIVARWAYLDAEGRLMGYANRVEWVEPETGETKKDVLPCVYCLNKATGKRQWRWKAMPKPRVLFNLPALLARPDDPVIVVEGEKKVIPAQTIAPKYVGIAWAGGCRAWKMTDWKPLKGRKVLLWPDADEPGIQAMWEIGHHLLKLCPEVKFILVDDKPKSWDAADALADNWNWDTFKAWAVPRVKLITEGNDDANGNDGRRDAGRASAGGTGRGSARGESADADQSGRGELGGSAGAEEAPPWVAVEDADAVAGRGQHARPDADHGGEDRPAAQGDRRPAEGSGRTEQVVDAYEAGSGRRDDRDQQADAGTGDRTRIRPRGRERDRDQAAQGSQSRVSTWLAWGLQQNGNGTPLANLNNAVRVLECDPLKEGLVWYEEFQQRIYTMGVDNQPRPWLDVDNKNLVLYMQRELELKNTKVGDVRDAIDIMARRDMRNEVKEYIEAEAWDGEPRLDTFFIDTFGARDSEYTRAVGRNFWISMVARIYEPGCQVDNMVVLEGPQGIGKSSALRIIGGKWYCVQSESARDAKAFAEVLKGKLVVEIDEMDSFERAEAKSIKSAISRTADSYRGAYKPDAEDFKRTNVLVGTSNTDDYNKDATGARRLWPIKCRFVDLPRVARLRAQLFAEALARYRQGEKWHEVPADQAKAEQDARYDDDVWQGDIAHYLLGRTITCTPDILRDCLKLELVQMTKPLHGRVAEILKRLGWRKVGNKRINGSMRKAWVPIGSQDDIDEMATEVATPEVATEKVPVINDLPFM